MNLVNRKTEVLQKPKSLFINVHSNRCFPDRVGSSLQQGSNIWAMVRGRESLIHKCAGTTSNKIGCNFPHQREKSESHTLPDNKVALSYLFKMGEQRRNI